MKILFPPFCILNDTARAHTRIVAAFVVELQLEVSNGIGVRILVILAPLRIERWCCVGSFFAGSQNKLLRVKCLALLRAKRAINDRQVELTWLTQAFNKPGVCSLTLCLVSDFFTNIALEKISIRLS